MERAARRKKSCWSRWPSEAGFTLAEVLVAGVIAALVLSGALYLLADAVRTWYRGERKIDAYQNLRIAVEMVVREVRSSRGLEDVTVYKDGRWHVLDGENLFLRAETGEVIWYYLEGDHLKRSVRNYPGGGFLGANTVAAGIKELQFIYDSVPPKNSSLVSIRVVGEPVPGRRVSLFSRARVRVRG